jgi:DNA-binding transcriptional LysR family regulator
MKKDAELGFLDFKRRVTLRQVEILASLKETGSITETARLLKTSPASISRICLRFEEHFNFPIFDKNRKGLIFTERGSLLIKCISRISNDVSSHYLEISEFFG